MNRYIITSPRFTGEINVLYGLDDKLLYIDFMKCELTDEQITYFKNKLPIYYNEQFAENFGNSKLDIIKEGYRVPFEQWWTRYNVKRNKDRCLKLWNALSEADQVNAYFKLGIYERFLAINTWRTKAEPDTYLRKRFWENEYK
jgi:hypothetical protein